jgi:hypothetical protein
LWLESKTGTQMAPARHKLLLLQSQLVARRYQYDFHCAAHWPIKPQEIVLRPFKIKKNF